MAEIATPEHPLIRWITKDLSDDWLRVRPESDRAQQKLWYGSNGLVFAFSGAFTDGLTQTTMDRGGEGAGDGIRASRREVWGGPG